MPQPLDLLLIELLIFNQLTIFTLLMNAALLFDRCPKMLLFLTKICASLIRNRGTLSQLCSWHLRRCSSEAINVGLWLRWPATVPYVLGDFARQCGLMISLLLFAQ